MNDHRNPSFLNEKNELLGQSFPVLEETNDFRQMFPEIIGESKALHLILRDILKIARSNSSVLVLGESGTGKELIASAIHRLSQRADKNFTAINCSAIPEDLLEAELFGHEKGAFTGADRKRIGLFGMAHQGTLFLDEIGDMPARLQAKLLRVIQEKKFTPLGSNEVKDVDIRFIAATNKNLEQAIEEGSFRLDLYYRLNVLPINLPPLRARAGDVKFLARYFIDCYNRINFDKPPCWLDHEVLDKFEEYHWPGNVRQLQNLIERLCIMKSGGRITLADLPIDILNIFHKSEISPSVLKSTLKPVFESSAQTEKTSELPEEGLDLCSYIENLENSLIRQALLRTQNNKNQAAKLLGLNRTTLVERIKKRQIQS